MKHPWIYDESPNKLDVLIYKVSKMLYKDKKRILGSFELTCPQFDILSAIYQFSVQKREIIQVDLSNVTNIDAMTTSTILRNLQKKGMIKRTRGVINTRTVVVELTDKGFDAYKKAMMKINSRNNLLYQNVDKEFLASQLNELSDRLNQTN